MLILKDFHYQTSANVGLYTAADSAAIQLEGSSIECTCQNSDAAKLEFCRGVFARHELILGGTGSLDIQIPADNIENDTVSLVENTAIYALGYLFINDSPTLNVSVGDITLKGGSIPVEGTRYMAAVGAAITGIEDIVIRGQAKVTAVSGSVNVENTADAENVITDAGCFGIRAVGNIKILGKAAVHASAGDCGSSGTGGGVLTGVSGSYGIYTAGDMTVEGGDAEAKSGKTVTFSSTGIYAEGDLNLNAGIAMGIADTVTDPKEGEGSFGVQALGK